MKTLLATFGIVFLMTSCHHQKAVTSANSAPANGMENTTITTTQGDVQIATDPSTTATIIIDNPVDSAVTTVVAENQEEEIYRLTVSFISKGEGIDEKTLESFENWLKMQPKQPVFEITHWGREGETNYCLKLNELSTREQEIFVKDVRTQLTDKELVFVTEYAKCKGSK
ncbi:hypothetical protein BH09BAC5_BH09BAC5_19150 [soil metagenome]